MEKVPVLSMIFLLPLGMAVLLCGVRPTAQRLIRCAAAGTMGCTLLLTIVVGLQYDFSLGGMQFVERMPWVRDLGVSYALGVDGISLPMLFLTQLIGFSAVFSSWLEAEL